MANRLIFGDVVQQMQDDINNDPALAKQPVLIQYFTKEIYEEYYGITITDQDWIDKVESATSDFAAFVSDVTWAEFLP